MRHDFAHSNLRDRASAVRKCAKLELGAFCSSASLRTSSHDHQQAYEQSPDHHTADELAYEIDGARVILTRASRSGVEDPFDVFAEWDSDADRKAYAGL
jgi:antitoxin PrlF